MPGFELAEPIQSFTLTCPDTGAAEISAIRARGNLPLLVDGRVLAEIKADDLNDNWNAAARLPAVQALRLAESAGRRLCECLEDHIDETDLTDMVSDAAILFLLALRRHGLPCAAKVPPCEVVWRSTAGQADVAMRALGGDDDGP